MTESSGTVPTVMRAAVLDRLGPPDVLHLVERPVPVPAEGEVLVRVHAAGLNAMDWFTRVGDGVPVPDFPAVLGWDLSGTVAALGPQVNTLAVGEPVFGMPRFPELVGTYAEYAVAPAAGLARKPAQVSHAVAAAVPMPGLTAWQTVVTHAQVSAGQRVLVPGAAGGVAQVVIQLAKLAGAEVIGTASPDSFDFVRSLGADRVLDYRQPVSQAVKDVDVVVDPRGGEDFTALLDVLQPGGIIVTLKGKEPGQEEQARARGLRVGYTYVTPDAAALTEIAQRLADGRLTITIAQAFPLGEARAAHEAGERGHVRGRLVLTVADSDPSTR